jgi:hypothetical protein
LRFTATAPPPKTPPGLAAQVFNTPGEAAYAFRMKWTSRGCQNVARFKMLIFFLFFSLALHYE